MTTALKCPLLNSDQRRRRSVEATLLRRGNAADLRGGQSLVIIGAGGVGQGEEIDPLGMGPVILMISRYIPTVMAIYQL